MEMDKDTNAKKDTDKDLDRDPDRGTEFRESMYCHGIVIENFCIITNFRVIT
jgi:hypothetical protein